MSAILLLVLLLKEVGNTRLGERFTPNQYKDLSHTISTYRKKEEKWKPDEDQKGASSLGE